LKEFNNILVNKYQNVYNYKLEKYEKFRSSNLLKDSNGKLIQLKSFEDKMKDDLLFTVFKTDEQSRKYAEDEKVGIFLTLTLDSVYHDFFKKKKNKRTGKSYISNKYTYEEYKQFHINNNNLDLTDIEEYELELEEFFGENYPLDSVKIDRNKVIKSGYKVLQESFRRIYNKFNVDRDYVKLPYSRVIEPHHGDFTPHLHAIIFVDRDKLEALLIHIKKTIKIFQKSGNLGRQFDIEVLNDTKKTGGYITKYIRKSLESTFVKGWSQAHKIRLFQTSRDILPRYIFKILSGKIVITDEDLVDSSYINEHLKKICVISVNNTNGSRKIYGNRSSQRRLIIFKEVVQVESSDIDDSEYTKVVDYQFSLDNNVYLRKESYEFVKLTD